MDAGNRVAGYSVGQEGTLRLGVEGIPWKGEDRSGLEAEGHGRYRRGCGAPE